jgi:hypothetical protein
VFEGNQVTELKVLAPDVDAGRIRQGGFNFNPEQVEAAAADAKQKTLWNDMSVAQVVAGPTVARPGGEIRG